MEKIKIVTDSTTDLSEDVLDEYSIHVVPLSIHIDGKTFVDQVDITPDDFITEMAQSSNLPKTSQPAVGELIAKYEELGKHGEHVLSIHLASTLSGTYETARMAAEEANAEVTVVDSMYISSALGFQVVEAAKMAAAEASIDDILDRLKTIKQNSRLYVVVETFDNLVKGGRIGKGKALLGSLLKLKPIAALEEGVYTPVAKVRTQSQMIQTLMKYFKQDSEDRKVKGISISHANASDLAHKLKNAATQESRFKDIMIQTTTPIISTHTGEGAIGLSYYTDSR
ncbi:DegV family protein [Natribacillus halophilus]|uniref:EDD domain protein, DegV family n=1 Tax=Natribacillus halophilus TaxID=549003 RepID=A0A1G8LCP2_9BACI|nr:DegV family protein [Natribacillus halophilus]SDI53217.1 EDD domain protein, DegV family [Natribacillus halophilus]